MTSFNDIDILADLDNRFFGVLDHTPREVSATCRPCTLCLRLQVCQLVHATHVLTSQPSYEDQYTQSFDSSMEAILPAPPKIVSLPPMNTAAELQSPDDGLHLQDSGGHHTGHQGMCTCSGSHHSTHVAI